MATTKRMTKVATNPVDTENVETSVGEVTKTDYEQEELIDCRSITGGNLFIEGKRSGFLYQWADYDDVIGVEYRDLVYMIRSNDKSVFEPRIIITDENIVSQYPQLEKLYANLYTFSDLRDILSLPAHQIKTEVEKLPVGAKNALRSIISTMIDTKELDSVARIKVLDDIFGTKMLLTLAEG